MPSHDVIKIVRQCETVLRSTVNIELIHSNQWENVLVSTMVASLPNSFFSGLNDHFVETARGVDMDTHYSILVKMLCQQFLKVRRFHAINMTNIVLEGDSVRKLCNKTVLFKHQ